MRRFGSAVIAGVIFCLGAAGAASLPAVEIEEGAETPETIKLPPARRRGPLSVEEALQRRRSPRRYAETPLTLSQIGQLLWAAQGITQPLQGKRTAPSAMTLYPLEIDLIAVDVEGLAPGLYRYLPRGHLLERRGDGEIRRALLDVVRQRAVRRAPAVLILVGLTWRSPNPVWIDLEAGHVAQNVYLQAEALGLGTVCQAGFTAEKVRNALRLKPKSRPIYLMPVGHPPSRGD